MEMKHMLIKKWLKKICVEPEKSNGVEGVNIVAIRENPNQIPTATMQNKIEV